MQNIKPNRAQRRAAQSNGKPKCQASRRSFELTIRHIEKQLHSIEKPSAKAGRFRLARVARFM